MLKNKANFRKLPILCLVLLLIISNNYAQINKKVPNKSVENLQWLSETCSTEKKFFENAHKIPLQNYPNLNEFTRDRALKISKTLAIKPADRSSWNQLLPCCPETYQDTFENGMWEQSSTGLACFHPGAVKGIRTSKLYHQIIKSNRHGQQCTYNMKGDLIVSGAGAGTPDFVSPNISDSEHFEFDVFPWIRMSAAEYNAVWIPDAGCNRSFSNKTWADRWTHTLLYVRKGDIIEFSNASGQVKFDLEGNSTGPEGSRIIPKTREGLLGRIIAPNPVPTALPGALIGAILTTFDDENSIDMNKMSIPFEIGKGTTVEILAEGFLMLGVNDGYLENNSGGFQVYIRRVSRRR